MFYTYTGHLLFMTNRNLPIAFNFRFGLIIGVVSSLSISVLAIYLTLLSWPGAWAIPIFVTLLSITIFVQSLIESSNGRFVAPIFVALFCLVSSVIFVHTPDARQKIILTFSRVLPTRTLAAIAANETQLNATTACQELHLRKKGVDCLDGLSRNVHLFEKSP